MESDIKCLECGKITRKVELGKIFYALESPSKTILIENTIICPKCSKDISNGKCALKINETLMKLVAANISISIGEIPEHLSGTYYLNKKEYEKTRMICKSKPKMVSKF